MNKIFAALPQFLSTHSSKIRSFFYLLLVQLFVLTVGFFTQIKIANTLGKELFGQLAYGLAISVYGQVFIRFGLDRTLVRDLVHNPEKAGCIIAASLTLRYTLAVLLLGGLVIWRYFFTADISWGLLLIIIGFSFLSLDLQPVYDAWKRIPRHATYYLIQKTIYFSAIWFIVLFCPDDLSINWIGTAVIASVTVFLVLQHRWVMNKLNYETKIEYSFSAAYQLGRQNFILWLAAFSGLFIVYFNQLILKHYAGFSELGGYAAAWQIVMLGMLFLEQIARIGYPATAHFTRKDSPPNAKKGFLLKYVCVMMVSAFPVVLTMSIFPEHIFKLLFRPEYSTASILLPIFSIYLVLISLGMVASQYLLAVGKEGFYFFTAVLGGAISLALCVLLIPAYGIVGAAWTVCISHGVIILFNSLYVLNTLKRNINDQ